VGWIFLAGDWDHKAVQAKVLNEVTETGTVLGGHPKEGLRIRHTRVRGEDRGLNQGTAPQVTCGTRASGRLLER
jgi:hypothetical protein